jgi:GNAT superfamily N-acetyltransferase
VALAHRLARAEDIPDLERVMAAAIAELQRGFRDAALLDAHRDPARVRAMYTDPAFARRGVGRLILRLCEAAAAAEGFTRLELMATLAGRALYARCGYEDIEAIADARGGAPVPLVRMGKQIAPPQGKLPRRG